MLGNIGGAELFFIMVVILLLFGAKRIPEIARGLGQGIREFKNATREISRELKLEEDAIRRPHPEAVPTGRRDITQQETGIDQGRE